MTNLDFDLADFEVLRQRLINVGIVNVYWVHVGFLLEQIERYHLPAIVLRGLILEEPLR